MQKTHQTPGWGWGQGQSPLCPSTGCREHVKSCVPSNGALCKFSHHHVSTTLGISFFAATITVKPCPLAEGKKRCIPLKHPSDTRGILLYSFLSPGNGYIEGKELENFFQELESARKGAGVVRASPGFPFFLPCSLFPEGSGSHESHLLWAWHLGAGPQHLQEETGVNASMGRGDKCSHLRSLLSGLKERQLG